MHPAYFKSCPATLLGPPFLVHLAFGVIESRYGCVRFLFLINGSTQYISKHIYVVHLAFLFSKTVSYNGSTKEQASVSPHFATVIPPRRWTGLFLPGPFSSIVLALTIESMWDSVKIKNGYMRVVGIVIVSLAGRRLNMCRSLVVRAK